MSPSIKNLFNSLTLTTYFLKVNLNVEKISGNLINIAKNIIHLIKWFTLYALKKCLILTVIIVLFIQDVIQREFVI